MLKRSVYLFIWLVLPLLSFGNSQAHDLFEKANAYYAKAQYKEALAAYQQIINGGDQSAAIYFNMGNACYKLDSIPAALLYFEKAHKLAPGDDDINFNIQYTNLKTTDKIEEVPEFFLARWLRAFVMELSVNVLSIWSVVLFLSGSALLILYFFATAIVVKKSSFYAGITLFFLGILTIFIANRQVSYFDDHRQAIIFSSSVTVKSGPVERAGTLFVIHDGTKVNIVGDSNGWIRIRLANGNEGWVKASDVKEI